MITINKAYFVGKNDYSWLGDKLAPEFNLIIGDKTKIIYGFNGIGKSSFTNCLRAYNKTENLFFLDYETIDSQYNSTSIRISPLIYEIEKITKEIDDAEGTIDFASLSKKQGLVKKDTTKGPAFLKDYVKSLKTKERSAKIKVGNMDYKEFLGKHSDSNPQDFFKIVNSLESVATSSKELENYKKDKFRNLLEKLKEHIVDNNKCPVCDSFVLNINSVIEKKITLLEKCKSSLVNLMEENGIPHDEKTIDDYLRLYNELSSDSNLLNDYIICGNDYTKHVEIASTIENISKKNTTLRTYASKKKEKYNQIKLYENRFKADVARYLKIKESSVCFDDPANEITISLGRDPRTYSTGERHILWFLVEIYSFLGSDSSTMVLDDPASSLDLVNLYKIAFEIVKRASSDDKYLVVFTHSSDLVNAINLQSSNKFDFYYLEEHNGTIFLDEINYKGKGTSNVIDTKHFERMNPNIFDSLKKRDYQGHGSPEHAVYHYSLEEHKSLVDPDNLSNYSLINLIDTFSSFDKEDFYINSFNKVLYLLSLRVWLEKAMYNLIPSEDKNRQKDYLEKDTLHQKINVIANSKGAYTSNLFSENKIDKEDIICKKVMLNQNAHYYSQIMPFAYGINLSLDDIEIEIKQIKELFGC